VDGTSVPDCPLNDLLYGGFHGHLGAHVQWQLEKLLGWSGNFTHLVLISLPYVSGLIIRSSPYFSEAIKPPALNFAQREASRLHGGCFREKGNIA